jgi:hypothetical protein
VHRFTLIQLLCFGALWMIKSSKLGILFPLMIAAMVPIRALVGRLFQPEHIALMDAEDEQEALEMHLTD